MAALPAQLGGHEHREVSPVGAPAAAYGDPPVVVRCGVPEPAGVSPTSSCQTVDGVDWFVPESQIADATADVVATTLFRSPAVELTVPAEHRPPDAELADIAAAVKQQTARSGRCR